MWDCGTVVACLSVMLSASHYSQHFGPAQCKAICDTMFSHWYPSIKEKHAVATNLIAECSATVYFGGDRPMNRK